MKNVEETCCVVTVSEKPLILTSGSQNKEMSGSGVFLNYQSGIVVCSGSLFSRFINDKQFMKKHAKILHSERFAKKIKVNVDYIHVCTNQSCETDRGNANRQEAQLLMMINCVEFQDAFLKIFQGADNWGFHSGNLDTEVLEDSRFLSWFALLKVPTSSTCTCKETIPWVKSGSLKKGCPVMACGSPFGGLCPDLFMNTISKGVVSNLAGDENALILTDARCLPGTEGGGVFVSKGGRSYLLGLIVSPLCWKSDEWIGLTLVCSVHLILKNMLQAGVIQESLIEKSSQLITGSLQAPLTANRKPSSEFYPGVALIESGQLWGSGVLLNQNLVLTCRHVVNENTLVTVRVNNGGRFRTVYGKVLYSSAPSSPYDIAVVELQEPLADSVKTQFTTYFHPGEDVFVVGYGALGRSCGPSLTSGILSRVITHQSRPVMLQTTCAVQSGASGGAVVRSATGELLGIVSSNTRDFAAKVTYPHLNFSIPVTVLEPLLRRFSQTGDAAVFKVLDSAEDDIKKIWRLQSIQSKL
ncbi:Peroxisomal leader peptide-processing protease [Labeo rohita]|uniref:Peroxisomal leader peptide-processing protease n=1 Tax=Labeo rohita TaxID=84645 RepID=A0ABQ8M4Q3_LABRO|nr:peroxisomal leader peptide-processing protease [Labeo rohita]KAI2657880.1 Peroxisomal leader peptide-processing protease [Labeo rohita]